MLNLEAKGDTLVQGLSRLSRSHLAYMTGTDTLVHTPLGARPSIPGVCSAMRTGYWAVLV